MRVSKDQLAVSRKRRLVTHLFYTICLLLTIFLPALSTEAQDRAKLPKIGWLGQRPIADPGGGYEILRQELRAIGYVEGKNITLEYRSADNHPDRLPALADELVRLKVDVIVAPAGNEAVAAKKATRVIPIVFASGGDPIAAKLVNSLARPGGNVTGYTGISAALAGKRLELIKETLPKISRVGLLWNRRDVNSQQTWKESQQPSKALGLQLYSMEIESPDKLTGIFKEATNSHIAALVVSGSPLFNSHLKEVAELAIKTRLPTMGSREDFADAGGLMSYGPDRADQYRHAALYVDKILKGAKPADLPVEQPTEFELVINYKTAKLLGLSIPSLVAMRAQRVIR